MQTKRKNGTHPNFSLGFKQKKELTMANFHLISSLVEERRMLIKELCEQAGISDQTYRQILIRNSTKTEILERIAKVLQVSVGYFFDEPTSLAKNNSDQKEIEHLKDIINEKNKIIDEKERLISVLMGKA
jgi:Helix-turn-helix.